MRISRNSSMAMLVASTMAGCRTGEGRGLAAANPDTGPELSPMKRANGQPEQALVRVVHAVPGAPAVDVRADDRPAFHDIAFKTVTPYHVVADTRPKITVLPAGVPAAEPLAQNAEPMNDGERYTMLAVASDDGQGVDLETVRDDPRQPSVDKARVRVINAAPHLGKLDVMVEARGQALFTGLGFKDGGGFKEIDPGQPTLLVTTMSHRVLLRLPHIPLLAGQSLTLVLTHPSANSHRLDAIQVIDDATPSQR